jgi:hypothetical protein
LKATDVARFSTVSGRDFGGLSFVNNLTVVNGYIRQFNGWSWNWIWWGSAAKLSERSVERFAERWMERLVGEGRGISATSDEKREKSF